MSIDILTKAKLFVALVVLFYSVGCNSASEEETSSTSDQTSIEEQAETEIEKETVVVEETDVPQASKLNEKLTEMSAAAQERLPAEVLQIFGEGIEQVRSTGIEEQALNVGDQAIDAELPDAKQELVKLSELWSQGPIVLMWYRGGWCPYCNIQLAAMQESLPAIQSAGARLVAMTPETPDNSMTTSEKNNLEFVVLSDVGNKVAREYGLVFKLPEKVSPIYKQKINLSKFNGDDSDELPLAATYVIDQSGKIRYAFLDADYTKRAEPAAILEALNSL